MCVEGGDWVVVVGMNWETGLFEVVWCEVGGDLRMVKRVKVW